MTYASSEWLTQFLNAPMNGYDPSRVLHDRKQRVRRCDGENSTIQRDLTYDHGKPHQDVVPNHIMRTSMHRSSPLGHRPSARALISQYEAISQPYGTSPSTRPSQQYLNVPPSGRDQPLKNTPSPIKPKAQAPFSFRNLLAVFGKRNKGVKAIQYDPPISNSKPVIPQTEDVFYSSSPYSGYALYLSSSTSPPTWRRCHLTLHPLHLTVKFVEDVRHDVYVIPFAYCVDIASLARYQLGRDIPTPPIYRDKEVEKVAHVFEMTFEGREPIKERLAVWTVTERGRWVSAAWDAILACRSQSTTYSQTRVVSPYDTIRRPPLKVVNGTSLPSSTSSSPSFGGLQTNDGPQPVQGKAPEAQDSRSSISSATLPITPTRSFRRGAPSQPSSKPPGLPSSSSIQTLGSMSIVRQRLAKLDSQEHPPHARSLARRVSSSKNHVTASQIHHTSDSDRDAQSNFQSRTSKHSSRLQRTDTTTTRVSNEESSQETLFTALDAHAMYHDYPDGTNDNELGNAKNEDQDVQYLEQDIHSLIVSFHEQAANQSSQTLGLEETPASADDGVGNIVTNMKMLPIGINKDDLAPLHAKLDQIKNGMAAVDTGTIRTSLEEIISASQGHLYSTLFLPLIAKLEELQGDITGDLPLALQKLKELEVPAAAATDNASVLVKLEEIMDVVRASSETRPLQPDLEDIRKKMNEVIALCTILTDKSRLLDGSSTEVMTLRNVSRSKGLAQSSSEGDNTQTERSDPHSIREPIVEAEQISRLLELLQSDHAGREIQAKQQAESVRYLHELNTWLENFVASSTNNMHQIASSIDRMCKESPFPAELEAQADPSGSRASEADTSPRSDNVLVSLHRFLAQQKDKDEDLHNLQASIQDLTTTLREDMAKNAETRSEVLRNAQLQETMLKALAAELTREIRGERLRFVDAMKDATSVNVSLHVEEFKKILGRLYQEKVVLEHQIAELFSFVTKQRQGQPDQAPSQPRHNNMSLKHPRQTPRPLPQINHQKALSRRAGRETSS